MAETYSESVVSILDRRKQLKQQRRSQFLQAFWRTFAIFGGVLFMGWFFSRPEWKIRQASQVQIIGNSQLSTRTLETFLPLSFPTSLLRIQPNAIRGALEHHTHIEKVWINRALFPPHITVKVQERPPVALAFCPGCIFVANLDRQPVPLGPTNLWLLDTQGIPLPYESYPKLQQSGTMPSLTVSGYFNPIAPENDKQIRAKLPKGLSNLVEVRPETQSHWKTLFETVRKSPVKISAIDLENPENLTIKTEFGVIRLGPYGPKFAEQLQALDQMRALPQRLNLQKIKSIDLADPKHPVIELNQPIQSPKPQSKL
jgi:cell division protein FtsQ